MVDKLRVEYDLDTKSALRAIKQIEKSVDGLANTSKSAFGSITGAFNVFAGALAAGIAFKALDKIGQAVGDVQGNFIEFSKAMAEINSILPINAQLTDESRVAFIKFSDSFAGDPQTQAKAFYSIVSAGVKTTAKQLKVLEQANKAAVAGLVDINTAAFVLVSSVNAYAEASLTAEQASDTLFVAVREGQTDFGKLASSIGRVAPLAASAGLSFSELAGTIAFVTKSGVATAEAVTGLRAILTAIIKPSSEAATKAKELGLAFSSAAIEGEDGFLKFINNVRIATKGNVDDLSKLFGSVEALAPILQLTGNQFGEFQRILNATSDSVGATEAAFKIISKSAAFQFERLIQQLQNLPQAFLINFEEPIASAIKAMREFVGGNGILLVIKGVDLLVDSFAFLSNAFTVISVSTSLAQFKIIGLSVSFREIVLSIDKFSKSANDFLGIVNSRVNNAIKINEFVIKSLKEERAEIKLSAGAAIKANADRLASIENFRKQLREGALKQLQDNRDANSKREEDDKKSFEKSTENIIGEKKKEINIRQLLLDAFLDRERDRIRQAALGRQIELGEAFNQEQETKLEQEELAKLAEEFKAEEELQFLSDKLGRENALREIFAAQQLANDNKVGEAKKKLRAAEEKATKSSAFRILKTEELTQKQKLGILQSSFAQISTLTQSSNKTLFRIGQGAAAANAAINIAQGITKALALGPILGPVLSILIAAAGAIQIAKITSQKPPSGAFQFGGTVPIQGGQVGDPQTIRVNGGEEVLTQRQSRNLFEAINRNELGGGGGGIEINISGANFSDDSIIDQIVEGINDGTEFRNLELKGVNVA